MRLQGGALSFGFASGRELECFHICAVVSATARPWECDLRSRGDAGFGGSLAAKQNGALRRCSILFFSAGVAAFALWGGKQVNVGVVWAATMAVLSLPAASILIFSKSFAREFAAEREKRPPYKKYLLHAFTLLIVLAVAAATLVDIVSFIQLANGK
jgi:hypothetical protein